MTSKIWQRIFSIFLLAGMLLGFAQPVGVQASTIDAQAVEKIEKLVLDEISTEGTTAFFVWMTEKADLSPADQLQTKAEKGQFVFDTLVATANRTQKNLRSFLDGQGVDYEAFYISNKILVRGGNLDLAMTIAGLADVAEITANHQYQLEEPFIDLTASGPESPNAIETNITFINADDVWGMGITGQGTVMAGNDTGLDWDHPAIINKYRGWNGSVADHNFNWWDATGTYPTVPGDGHGHGTHTTGTMVGDDGVGNQIGVAPGAQTVHCKNMTDSGSGSDATFTTCFQFDLAPWDLNQANANPALAPDAINNSWGYSGGNQNQFRDEIIALHAAGILVEVSAGNEGSSCATLRSPGDYTEVLTTGSIQHSSGVMPGTITGFSSRGPSDLDGNYFPDIMAPGENIRSSVPGGGYEGGWSGTSMAGPHATALVGLIWSACPSMTGQVTQTLDLIRNTAVPLTGQNGSNCGGDYTTGPNNDWGMGTIDALAAVQYALSMCSGVGQLDGTVMDAVTAQPVQDVSVTADWSGGGSWNQTTDVTGYYAFTAVPAGDYAVTFEHPMYTTLVANTTVTTDTLTTLDVDLTPRGLLFGYVTDGDNGFALEGATVEAEDGTTATTDVNGYYEMYLDEGAHTITASLDEYASDSADVNIVSGQSTQQDFALLAAVSFLPAPLHVYVDWESNATFPATLTNRQATDYAFEFSEINDGYQPGLDATWPGPDGYGYTGEALDYEWIDISTTGTPVTSLSDDSYAGPYNVGFTFPFYAGTQTQFYVSSNGFLSFGSGSTALTNQCPLPNATAPDNVIPLMWDDLYPNYTTGGVYYQSFPSCPTGAGACLVLEYLNWNHYGGTAGSAGTFEAVLYENGSIRMNFLDSGLEAGSGSTTGVEDTNSGANYGLTYACDTANSLLDNTSICYIYPDSSGCVGEDVPWVGEEPLAGTVPAGSSIDITMLFTATAEAGVTQPGDYLATLLVLGNPGLQIPVVMTVQPGDDMGQLHGYVTDVCTNEPVEALVEITNGDPISQTMSDPDTGYYSAWLFAGQYETTFSAPGYLDFTTTADIPAGGEFVLDASMVPDHACASVQPESFEVWVLTGTQVYTDEFGLDIYNAGGADNPYTIIEEEGGYAPARTSQPVYDLQPSIPANVTTGINPLGYALEGDVNGGTPQGAWQALTAVPFTAMDHVYVDYDGLGYLLGAYGGSGQVGIYNPDTNSWTLGATEPSPQIAYSVDGCVGEDAGGNGVIVLFNDTTSGATTLHRYNVATNTWDTPAVPAGFPANGLWAHDALSMIDYTGENVCYISGGATTPGGGNTSTLYAYYPDTNTALNLGDFSYLSGGFAFHASWYAPWIGTDGAVCVGGGVNASSVVTDATQCYDIGAGVFNAVNADLGAMPAGLWGMADGILYESGDYQLWVSNGADASFALWPNSAYFSAGDGTWHVGPTPSTTVYRVEGTNIESADGYSFYVGGGSTGGFAPSTGHNRNFSADTPPVVTPVDVPWVWEEPLTGTVPAQDMVNVEVMFTALYTDSTPMPLGTYTTTMVVLNEAPGNGEIYIPVTMHIIEEPIIPTATFTAESPVCFGEPVALDNTTTPGVPPQTTYTWDFGDGTTSNEEEPGSHLYDAPGSYTITLTACNTAGCDDYSLVVEVLPLPEAGFTYVVDELTVVFTNASTDAETYLWDFGDGITDTLTDPTHTYAAAGTYTVTLMAFGECGISQAQAVVTVAEAPDEADLSVTKAGPATVDVGDTVTYTLTVANAGPDAAVNVVMTDALPEGVTFVSATSPCVEAEGVVTCELGDLVSGGSVVIEIVVTAPDVAGTLSNTAAVTSDTLDPDETNNTDSFDTLVETGVYYTYLTLTYKH